MPEAPTVTVLTAAREKQGLTQQQMATRLRVSQPTVHWWETGRKAPRATRIPEVAAAYKVDVTRLLRFFAKNSEAA